MHAFGRQRLGLTIAPNNRFAASGGAVNCKDEGERRKDELASRGRVNRDVVRLRSIRMIANTPTRPLVSLAASMLVAVASACEGQPSATRIEIDRKNPPTFFFSGNGQVSSIVVTDVSANDLSGVDPERIMWEIVPTGETKPSHFPKITYGVVPHGFVQRTPASGPPRPLHEEKPYRVTAPTTGADSRKLIFLIRNGQALYVTMADDTEWYVETPTPD